MFEAVYHSLFQMSTLSDCETHVIWSFAIDSWISDFISHCHCWFHFQTFKNQFRSECSDNNHLQVLQKNEIHFQQRNMNCCWMSKIYFVNITNWSILIIWIENRDSKWLSEFWIQLFSDMKIRIMIIMIYHSQFNS